MSCKVPGCNPNKPLPPTTKKNSFVVVKGPWPVVADYNKK
jgi:hypothetical protein